MSGNRAMGLAIIGGGMVAGTHLAALADLAGRCELRGVFLRDRQKAHSFTQQASRALGRDIGLYDSVAAIAADDRVDFGLVLTPPDARLAIARELAEAGKAILMEKPLERTTGAALEIVEMCETCNVTLGVVFQHRMRGASKLLKGRLATGEFGRLSVVEASVPWWRDQGYYDEPGRGTLARDGGGVLITQAIHTLDLMLSVTGPVRAVQAMAATTSLHRMETEDFVTAGLSFESGAVGSLRASTALFPGEAEALTFHCAAAVVKLCAGVLDIHWRDGRVEQCGDAAATGGGADPMAFTHAWHRDLIGDFADALCQGRAPVASGRQALEVHYLIDALLASSSQGRVIEVAGR